ncbi:MAG: nucleotide sugar dehydrogenase [Nitrosarchaeum sp.]
MKTSSLSDTLDNVNQNDFEIIVFGLGYVGLPLSLRLATHGFQVIGVDTDSRKIISLKNKSLDSTHIELEPMLKETISNGKFLPATKLTKSSLPRIGIICVPTPIPDGKVNSETFVFAAADEFIKTAKKGDIIILESSVRGGTTDELIKKVKSKGYTVGEDFGVCFCPERIDPLNQKWKLENIPRIIYATGDTTFTIAQKIYGPVNNSNLFRVSSPKVAESVKSFENTFRLVNISLVNELAMLCDKLQIDIKEVLTAASTKPFGFMPFDSGAGAGGHCIPKDPLFLLDSAKKKGMTFSTIKTAVEINSELPEYIASEIKKTLTKMKLGKKVLVCGLAYKQDIEDMRDSPGFKIANILSKKGLDVSAFDPHYKKSLEKKYLIENHLKKIDFKILSNLDEKSISGFDCICIVQHHTKTKHQIDEFYTKSLVPLIYDCQNKITHNPKSKTALKGFGRVS